MASVAVIPKPGKIKPENLESIVMDVVEEENHDLSNTLTDHPVEQGGDVTDHIRQDPDVITLRCFISNTPLSRDQQTRAIKRGDITVTTSAEERGKVGADGLALGGWKKLRKLRDEGIIVTVSTTLGDYTSMAVKSISAPRNATNYDGLEFTITFRKIVIVRNKLTRNVKSSDPSTQRKAKAGAQTTKDAGSNKPTSFGFSFADEMTNSPNNDAAGTAGAVQNFLHN